MRVPCWVGSGVDAFARQQCLHLRGRAKGLVVVRIVERLDAIGVASQKKGVLAVRICYERVRQKVPSMGRMLETLRLNVPPMCMLRTFALNVSPMGPMLGKFLVETPHNLQLRWARSFNQ